MTGNTVRVRSETFSDHYSQARLFYRSITEPKKKHLGQAITFELSKIETDAIRLRMLGHLEIIDNKLAQQVREGLGVKGNVDKIIPARSRSTLTRALPFACTGNMKTPWLAAKSAYYSAQASTPN